MVRVLLVIDGHIIKLTMIKRISIYGTANGMEGMKYCQSRDFLSLYQEADNGQTHCSCNGCIILGDLEVEDEVAFADEVAAFESARAEVISRSNDVTASPE